MEGAAGARSPVSGKGLRSKRRAAGGWGGRGRQVTDPGGQRAHQQVTGWGSELAGGGRARLTLLMCGLCSPTGLCSPMTPVLAQ